MVQFPPVLPSMEVHVSPDRAAGMETEAGSLGSLSSRLQAPAVDLTGSSLLSTSHSRTQCPFALLSPFPPPVSFPSGEFVICHKQHL